MTSPHDSNGHADGKKENGSSSPFDQGSGNQNGRNGETPQPTRGTTRSPSGGSTRAPKRQRRGKDSPEPDYSAMVAEQMSTTNRTGQACDRCKGRKMKCDSNPTGCANCIASESVCTQTDPITKVSSIRGELERLRQDNATLLQENKELKRAFSRNSELLRSYQMGGGQPGVMGIPDMLQGRQTYGQPGSYGGPGSLSGSGHLSSPYPTTQSHYDPVTSTRGYGGDMFLNNDPLSLPPLLPQTHRHPNQPSYTAGPSGTNNNSYDIPTSAPGTSAPSQPSHAVHGNPFDQQPNPQNENKEYKGYTSQQKDWPY